MRVCLLGEAPVSRGRVAFLYVERRLASIFLFFVWPAIVLSAQAKGHKNEPARAHRANARALPRSAQSIPPVSTACVVHASPGRVCGGRGRLTAGHPPSHPTHPTRTPPGTTRVA